MDSLIPRNVYFTARMNLAALQARRALALATAFGCGRAEKCQLFWTQSYLLSMRFLGADKL